MTQTKLARTKVARIPHRHSILLGKHHPLEGAGRIIGNFGHEWLFYETKFYPLYWVSFFCCLLSSDMDCS